MMSNQSQTEAARKARHEAMLKMDRQIMEFLAAFPEGLAPVQIHQMTGLAKHDVHNFRKRNVDKLIIKRQFVSNQVMICYRLKPEVIQELKKI